MNMDGVRRLGARLLLFVEGDCFNFFFWGTPRVVFVPVLLYCSARARTASVRVRADTCVMRKGKFGSYGEISTRMTGVI